MNNILLKSYKKMFKEEQNPEELNKIMGTTSDKHDVSSNDNKKTSYIHLEEDIYQQMNLIKLEDLNVLPLEEIRRKLDQKYGKMIIEDEINEISEELDLGEIKTNLVNNVVPKHEVGEPSGRNIYFMRPRYVPVDIQPIFSFGSSQGKPRFLKKLALPQLVKHDTS